MESSQSGLWLVVIASGLYHGLSPGMGWPLAVSAALFEKKRSALFAALLPLAAGHFAAMALVLLPFAAADWLVERGQFLRIAAGIAVGGFGLWRLFDSSHPRVLARIKPSQLMLWSFMVAIAHGAGLLLVPIFLGMNPAGTHASHLQMANAAMSVAAVHTLAMLAGCGAMAWIVYRYLGLQFLKRSWFNLDVVWALSLILAGTAGILTALGGN